MVLLMQFGGDIVAETSAHFMLLLRRVPMTVSTLAEAHGPQPVARNLLGKRCDLAQTIPRKQSRSGSGVRDGTGSGCYQSLLLLCFNEP